MALDPFTALGIAGNVVQFVDFTWKLILGSRAIYNSSTGTSKDHAVIHTIAAVVTRLSDGITSSGASPELEKLATESKRIADELLKLLEKLKVKGKKTVWQSFAVAMKEVCSRHDIDELYTRRADIKALKRELLNALKPLPQDTSASLQPTPISVPTSDDLAGLCKSLQQVSLSLTALETKGHEAATDLEVLKSLYFNDMTARHGRIEDAHARTSSWIFKEETFDNHNPIDYVQWLRTEAGIYWIQGKPGSGKSTLIKFPCDHSETKRHLGVWAKSKGKTLVIAKHFLWLSGSQLQKSQEGLLRGLLFGILRECPELIPHVLKARSVLHHGLEFDISDSHSSSPSWTRAELMEVFRHLATQDLSTRFCFFIGALDEYHEERLTHLELIKTLMEFSTSPDIKLCVSSRPWTVFMDAFVESK